MMLVDINLLSDKERDRPAFVVAAIALILFGLVTAIVFYFLGNTYSNKQQVLAAQSAEVVSQQAAIQEQMVTTAALSDTQKLQKTVEWAEAYQYDTLPLIRELTSLLPERGFFLSFSFSTSNQVTITTQFDTSRDTAFYLTQLKASDMITDVVLSSVSYQPLTEEAVEETDGTVTEAEPTEEIMPRYLASYAITFLDTRMPADGTAVPVDPNAPPIEGETPTEDETPTEETTEEQPAETPTTETQPPADDAQGDDANE
jgi:type IV pilus assembly protein PilN